MSKESVRLRTGPEGCIRTAARRQHQSMVDALLAGESEPTEAEALIVDLLADFLNSADFPALRASSPALAGAVTAEVVLRRDETNQDELSPGFRLDVENVLDTPTTK